MATKFTLAELRLMHYLLCKQGETAVYYGITDPFYERVETAIEKLEKMIEGKEYSK